MVTKHGSVHEAPVEKIEPVAPTGIVGHMKAHRLAWVSALFWTLLLGVVLVSPQMQQGGFYEGLFALVLVLSVLRGFGKI